MRALEFKTTASMISVIWLVMMTGPVLAETQFNPEYQAVEWPQLMPEDDLNALMDPPDYLSEITDGSEADSVEALANNKNADAKTKRYQQALNSTRVMPEYNHKKIRIPGFVVPVFVDQAQKTMHFFVVPYFGACLHLPPPPPNQIIYVEYEKGLKVDNLYEPFWFEGTLTIEHKQTDIAAASYQMKVTRILPYTEE
mgnify:CR=1 FL=1